MLETTRRHLFLAGFMGTGKSVVGHAVAERLQYGFIDLDEMISSLTHRSIPDLFRVEGEETFRLIENRALRLAVIAPHSVIALGGGTPLLQSNANIIRATGRCWLLTATWESIWERVRGSMQERPLLGNVSTTDFEQFKIIAMPIIEKRQQAYRRVADHVVDTSRGTIESLSRRIVDEFTLDAAI